jgi:hypothetical protein
MSNEIFDAIADIAAMPTKLYSLTAIHFVPKFRYSLGWTQTVRKGMMIRIAEDAIVDVDYDNNKPPTHVISECRGTLYDTNFEIEVEDLQTWEVTTIKLFLVNHYRI